MEDVKKVDQLVEFLHNRRLLQEIIDDYEQSKMNHMTKHDWLDQQAEARVYDEVLYKQ